MADSTKSRDQFREQHTEEVAELRHSLIGPGHANLLINNNRFISTKQFAAGIAHEINNPLGIISGFAELALRNPALPPSAREDIKVIHSECNRAARVLHDLLIFAGERPLTTTAVDIKAILNQALEIKANSLSFHKIDVTTRFSPDLPRISSDPDQLIEVLLNIIDNGQQAMTEARGGGKLEMVALRIENRIRISISDNGLGIPRDNLDRIFHPFFTTKDVGKGTGLGLSISLGIIEQHGGRLWAESVPGEGSTFHLELPVDLDSPMGGVDLPMSAPGPAAVGEVTRRILVANDELGFRLLLSRALAPGGHLVDLTGNWAEAWNLVQNHSYDCIILNLGLPAESGMQLYERIRAYDGDLAAKCIFITGYLLTPELEASLAATGVPYLTKPFAISQIRSLVLQLAESGSYPRE